MFKYFKRCSIYCLLLVTISIFTMEKASSNVDTKTQKTVFLTGAAGFIGSNFLKYLFDKYPLYQFLVLDVLTYAGNLDNIPSYIKSSPRFKFFYGSITNQRLVDFLMSQADFVVHFAAESHVTRSINDASIFFETDVIGTWGMLDSLVRHKNVERFIHISTSEVCGTAETIPMDENHPIKPRSPYAAAKAGADRLVYAYQCTYNIPTVIVRLFNNYGPQQHLEKMIPRFITSAFKGEPLTIHGTGLQTRDWMHVDDTSRALDIILHHNNFDQIKNELIHIGTGKETSVLEIAQSILKIFNLPETMLTFVPDRPGQVLCHISSKNKAKQLLNWEPTISLEEGLCRTVEWYRDHKKWCEAREMMQRVSISVAENIVVDQ